MKTLTFIISLFFTSLYGQKNWPYKYPLTLKPTSSEFTLKYDSLKTRQTKTLFSVFESYGDTVQGSYIIKIKSDKFDTILRNDIPNIRSRTLINLKSDEYSIIISGVDYSELKISSLRIQPNCMTQLIIKLGYKNSLEGGTINSKRKLTQKEIDELTNDLSSKLYRHKLLKKKVCIVTWDI